MERKRGRKSRNRGGGRIRGDMSRMKEKEGKILYAYFCFSIKDKYSVTLNLKWENFG
jgi:hypothetical protein